jgi:hypothetical protein
MSLSATTGSEFCTQQGSCEAQLSIGGSPTQLGTATPSLGSSSGSVLGTTTSLLERKEFLELKQVNQSKIFPQILFELKPTLVIRNAN